MIAWSKLRRALRMSRTNAPKVWDPDERILSISFDDFPRTAWTNGGDILQRHGLQATYFVAGALCGRTFDSQECYRLRDLEEVVRAGHEVGCHTYEHTDLTEIDRSSFLTSLDRNRDFLRQTVGVHPSTFAYPYGSLPALTIRGVCAERFDASRGVRIGVNSGLFDGSHLRAISFGSGERGRQRTEKILEQTAKTGGWLVLFTHDVQECPSPFGCRPRDLEWLIDRAKEGGFEIKTIQAACQKISLSR